MSDQNTIQLKPDRKSIISLILGIVSVGSISLSYLITLGVAIFGLMGVSQQIGIFLAGLFFIALISAILGLIFGIMGLKSTKRNFAIAGIVLSIIGLLVPLYYFLF